MPTPHAADPPFDPESYFAGRTKAWGIFQDRFGRLRRQFVVDVEGRREADILLLTEDFRYGDGERHRRIWQIRRVGERRYEGRAGDVLGVAQGTIEGNALRWRYDFRLVVGRAAWRVHFDDWMYRQDDEVVLNRSRVTKMGITIGEITLFFQKPSSAEWGDDPVRKVA